MKLLFLGLAILSVVICERVEYKMDEVQKLLGNCPIVDTEFIPIHEKCKKSENFRSYSSCSMEGFDRSTKETRKVLAKKLCKAIKLKNDQSKPICKCLKTCAKLESDHYECVINSCTVLLKKACGL